MATDVSLSHTMDDDIMFEKVRHMPRRTQFVSTHRQLSWQHERQLKQHERDQRLYSTEMSRAKTAMADKFSRLQDAKKQVEKEKTGSGRRNSAPSLQDADDSDVTSREGERTTDTPSSTMKHSRSMPTMKQFQQFQTSPTASSPSSPTMKQSHSSSTLSAFVIPEDSDKVKFSKRERVGSKRSRVSSWSDNVNAKPAAAPSIVEESTPERHGRAGRRATVAECFPVPEVTTLPPHLQRRLSEFMDSTATFALSCGIVSSGGEDRDQREEDRGDKLPDNVFRFTEEETASTAEAENSEVSEEPVVSN